MTGSELDALLDAHDGLIVAALDGTIGLADFVASYGGFPRSYALDGRAGAPVERAPPEKIRPRVAFHEEVAGVLAGFSSMDDDAQEASGLPGGFMGTVVMRRLRMLVARHPGFRVESPDGPRAA